MANVTIKRPMLPFAPRNPGLTLSQLLPNRERQKIVEMFVGPLLQSAASMAIATGPVTITAEHFEVEVGPKTTPLPKLAILPDGVRPEVDPYGIPRCDEGRCPSFDGKRCMVLKHRPESICEPGVSFLAARVGKIWPSR